MNARTLADVRTVRGRFARSVNLERDEGGPDVIDGYLPTSRSLDVVRRLTRALSDADAARAFSVTGPYGSGKSALAVFLDALLRPGSDTASTLARETLAVADPRSLEQLDVACRRLRVNGTGFARAFVTAEREPVTRTVLRGLRRAAAGLPLKRKRSTVDSIVAEIDEAIARFATPDAPRPTAQAVREILDRLCELAPVVLLIDEFGKTLESFRDAPAASDLYLLQQLAEWSHGERGLPLLTVALQHLSFGEYASETSEAHRRDLAKIHGRFEDIPFVDSADETRALIGAAWQPSSHTRFKRALAEWATLEFEKCRKSGLSALFGDPNQLAACWPLHPVAQLVLPELCARYGQNERTLFSFIASTERHAVRAFLEDFPTTCETLPSIGPDGVYDYFRDSAAGLAAVAPSASRWLEIETLIRDASGLGKLERRALKTVGVLNLAGTSGAVRASREIVAYALTSGAPPVAARTAKKILDDLERRGLVTFRDFADEYRLWQGSDFDLRAAVEAARRRLKTGNPADVMNRVKPLRPSVAGRHSHENHTLRVFSRQWFNAGTRTIRPPTLADPFDGTVVYALTPAELPVVESSETPSKPVIAVVPTDASGLVAAAIEVAALTEVLGTEERLQTDWVVRRELSERVATAQVEVDLQFEQVFGPNSGSTRVAVSRDSKPKRLRGTTLSAVLSEVADAAYPRSVQVRNEMLNRIELTSQGAKARRELVEAMIANGSAEKLAIEGYGPERAMYEASLASPGIHGKSKGQWGFKRPRNDSSFHAAWSAITLEFSKSKKNRLGLDAIERKLLAPPFGMRPAAIPVLLVAALVHAKEDVAIYEHGTYRPALTTEVAERMIRNPAHFEIKHFATTSGIRAAVLKRLEKKLTPLPRSVKERNATVVGILSHLVSQLVVPLPEFVRKTKTISVEAMAVRDALLTATEPDALLFESIPEALGHEAIPPVVAKRAGWAAHYQWIPRFLAILEELRSVYPRLLDRIEEALIEATGAPRDYRATLEARVRHAGTNVIEAKMRGFLSALQSPLDRDEWLAYIATTVVGRPPESWSDEEHARFFLLIRDIGASFRRLEALQYERAALNDTVVDVVRVTFTRPDGHEDAHLVWVDAGVREALHEHVSRFMAEVGEITGSEVRARDALLACLSAVDPAETPVDIAPARAIGRRRKRSLESGDV